LLRLLITIVQSQCPAFMYKACICKCTDTGHSGHYFRHLALPWLLVSVLLCADDNDAPSNLQWRQPRRSSPRRRHRARWQLRCQVAGVFVPVERCAPAGKQPASAATPTRTPCSCLQMGPGASRTLAPLLARAARQLNPPRPRLQV
jgi:hypothetical protein